MRKIRWMALIAVFALIAAACGGSDAETTEPPAAQPTAAPATAAPATTPPATDAPEPEGPKTIIIGTTDTIAGLDSADAYSVRDWEIIRNTGEGLMKFAPGTTDLELGIAESMDISDDGKTYTFKLRDNVRFGDGTTLTAPMYAAHIARLLSLDGSGGVGGPLAEAFIESYEATDDSTIVFHLHDAFGFFPQVVTGAPYHPMHPSYPSDKLVDFPETPFYGVGPWIMTSYTIGEDLVLEPNPFYYGTQPKVERVIVRDFADAQTMALAIQNGEIDIAWRTIAQPDILEQLEGTDGLTVARVPGGSIRYLIINHALEPTDDSNVRKAIASAIDRTEIVDRVSAGTWAELYSPIPPGYLGANEVFDDLYGSPNIEAARGFLEAAGYSEAQKLALTINYPPEHYGGTVADTMQVLSENLEATGMIAVTLNAQEWSTYVGAVTGGEDYGVSLLGWFFDYPDSSNWTEPFVYFGGLGTNVTNAENVAVDDVAAGLLKLLQDASVESDQAVRADLYEQAQAAYADSVATIPLWFEAEHVIYRDGVTGDSSAGNPNALNIGPSFDINYALLDITG